MTDAANPLDLQLRTSDEMWHKENLLNLVVQRFPADWKYGAYLDGDFHMTRPDWALEAIHQLQHYDFAQLFSSLFAAGGRLPAHLRHPRLCLCLPQPAARAVAQPAFLRRRAGGAWLSAANPSTRWAACSTPASWARPIGTWPWRSSENPTGTGSPRMRRSLRA